MMEPIFDTHAHYSDSRFDSDREELLRSMPQNGVTGIIECAVDLASSLEAIQLAQRYPFVYAAVGFHPENLQHATERDLAQIDKLLSNPKVVAVGEIGLDYYWNASPKDVQQKWFTAQIRMAKAHHLPVIVHDRDAHGDTLEILQREKPKGVLHAFSGSVEMMREVTKLGMYIGIGGAVTFKNARKVPDVAASAPLNRLLTETDAPYMTPEPFRGRRNDSTKIPYIAQTVAALRGITAEQYLRATVQNALTLFSLKGESP